VSRLSLQLRRTPLVVVPRVGRVGLDVLFFVQGGFGGGHGKFDGLIVALGLPSIYLVQIAPLPEWVLYFALTYTVILPTVMNRISVDRLSGCEKFPESRAASMLTPPAYS
jgi:hypothetical protein